MRQKGHNVELANSATEALKMIDHGLEFDILISDLMMPNMTGEEFVGVLRKKEFKQPMYIYTATPSYVRSRQHNGVFRKPEELDELINKISEY